MAEYKPITDAELGAMDEAGMRQYMASNAATMPMADMLSLPKRWKQLIDAIAAKALEAKRAALAAVSQNTLAMLQKTIDKVRADLVAQGADGVWLAIDFKAETASIRLLHVVEKAKAPRAAKGEGTGSSGYVTGYSMKELLEKVGSKAMFTEATDVTIAHETHSIPAGFTFQQAKDYNTNGGWQNRVRQAAIKAAAAS